MSSIRSISWFLLWSGLALPVVSAAADAIPATELGARAGALLQPEATAVVATPAGGARLAAPLQDLAGVLDPLGLRVESVDSPEGGGQLTIRPQWLGRAAGQGQAVAAEGRVTRTAREARLERSGLTERLTASGDGLRQDFVLDRRPEGDGDLHLDLAVTGAAAEAAGARVRLTLAGSGRKLSYGGLRVTDADGRELPARLEVTASERLRIAVADQGARYPLLIDPTLADEDWVAIGFGALAGTDGEVYALAFGDGVLYVGGSFDVVGDQIINDLAAWDGSHWRALGSGISNSGSVLALVLDGSGNLYAGGAFTQAGGVTVNNIAKWNGTIWAPLGSGINGAVRTILVEATGILYAGGVFTQAGAIAANRIAKWDGRAWSALGTGISGEYDYYTFVSALALDNMGMLYVGGEFTQAGGVPANNIAKWNGVAWSALGTGISGGVRTWVCNKVCALALDASGNLYAGGNFTQAGGIAANSISKWNGTTWTALSTGFSTPWESIGSVHTLVFDDSGNLHAGGRFDYAGGIKMHNIAMWDGTNWSSPVPMDPGVTGGGRFNALAFDDTGNLYVGGWFSRVVGGGGANNIARWDGAIWGGMVTGITGSINALALDRTGNLYAGGDFNQIGGMALQYLAKWDGATWSALGAGVDSRVDALVLDEAGNLYAGGGFTHAGGVLAKYVAKWDGTTWSALGADLPCCNLLDTNVLALALDGTGNLYVGGPFRKINSGDSSLSLTVNGIAKWDGAAWHALGSGTSGERWNAVRTIILNDAGDLYAGGDFTHIGGILVNNIAKWNGTVWISLAGGVAYDTGSGGEVYSLALDDDENLYVGGSFNQAGGVAAHGFAKWNGISWSALGLGSDVSVISALAVDRTGNLYAGGWNNVAKWDGAMWSAMGSGANGVVRALVLDQTAGHLFVGGSFSTAGGQFSSLVAQYDLVSDPATPRLSVTRTGTGGGTVTSTPAGIDCGTDCAERYASGTAVTLAATPDGGSTFGGWSGDGCSGSATTCTLTLNADRAVTANFARATQPGRVVTVPDIAGAAGSQRFFRILVPTGATNLTISTQGGGGNPNLHVKAGGKPQPTAADCSSTNAGTGEQCQLAALPTGGDCYILLDGVAAYTGVTLTVRWETVN